MRPTLPRRRYCASNSRGTCRLLRRCLMRGRHAHRGCDRALTADRAATRPTGAGLAAPAGYHPRPIARVLGRDLVPGDAIALATARTSTAAVDTMFSHVGNSMTPRVLTVPLFATHKRRARLLRSARAVQWFGILWNVGCAGFALWALLNNQRFSDAVADVTPLALVGGVGFLITWGIAGIIKIRAGSKTQSVPWSERATEYREPACGPFSRPVSKFVSRHAR